MVWQGIYRTDSFPVKNYSQDLFWYCTIDITQFWLNITQMGETDVFWQGRQSLETQQVFHNHILTN